MPNPYAELNSPYAEGIPELVQSMHRFFDATFGVRHPYTKALVAGDRCGSFLFFGMGSDPDRGELRRVRTGVEAKVFRGAIALRIACATEEEAIATAMAEALNMDHRLPGFIHQVNQVSGFYKWEISGDIDTPISQSIKDRDLWMVDVTTSCIARFMIKKDDAGQHQPIFEHYTTRS